VTSHGWLVVGLLSLGCAEILGLETPEPRPAPDKGGSSGNATGGTSGTQGGGEAGAPGGDAGTGTQGGSGGQGGSVTGGAGGSAGMGGSPDCTESERRCGGETTTTPEICDDTGNWIVNDDENDGEDCPVSCDEGRCIECEGQELGCNGNELRRCENGAWVHDTTCPHYCRNGTCENPVSCMGLADCLGKSCCSALEVPGGRFSRDYDGVVPYTDDTYEADLSTFLLDEFEVTVGRFRNFVRAYPIVIARNAGKAPHIVEDPG